MTIYRLGSIFYVLWGIMHVMFAIQIFVLNMGDSTYAVVQNIYNDAGPVTTPEVLGNVIYSIMNQHAWNLLWFGALSTYIGIFFNWKNSIYGYWSNLALVSFADLGFIGAVLIPGYVDPMVGIWGPIFWVLATIFSTLGIRQLK